MKFKPGQTGNPGGRPKKAGELRQIILEYLEREAEPGRTWNQVLVERVLGIVLNKSSKNADILRAVEYLHDRAYGKPGIMPEDVDPAAKEIKIILEKAQKKDAANPEV